MSRRSGGIEVVYTLKYPFLIGWYFGAALLCTTNII